MIAREDRRHLGTAASTVMVLALTFAAAYFVHGTATPRQVAAPAMAELPDVLPARTRQLLLFYPGATPERRAVIKEVMFWTEAAADRLCMSDQVNTLLAMAHRESAFDPKAKDGHPSKSFGVYQTLNHYERRLRRAWAMMGVTLGPRSEIRTQVYLGVLEYRNHLIGAHGEVLRAVQHYNGSGPHAELYAWRVLASRARIFGQAWTPNEKRIPATPCK